MTADTAPYQPHDGETGDAALSAALGYVAQVEREGREAVAAARESLLKHVAASADGLSLSEALRQLGAEGTNTMVASDAFVSLMSEHLLSLTADRRLVVAAAEVTA